jgi:transcriptional regulator with XRE-family HTH domain
MTAAAELVRDLRIRSGLTQRRLAVRAGTTQSAISRIERGVESPTVERLEQILVALGVGLVLETAPLEAWADPAELTEFAAMDPAVRLRHGIAVSRFASEVHQAGIRRRCRAPAS